MTPVSVQQHENKIKEAKERLARARQAFYDAKTDEEEYEALEKLTHAYMAKRAADSCLCKPVNLKKHIERKQLQRRDEQRINWNE